MYNHDHSSSSKRIGWAFFLNLIFTIIEFIGGWLTNSTAIMATKRTANLMRPPLSRACPEAPFHNDGTGSARWPGADAHA